MSTTNLDIAVEAGAKFIVVVNPLVPYVNDFEKRIPTLTGSRPRRVSDMGFPQIGYQAFKLLAHQRLHELARRWEQRYPGVDIVLIEPEPNDELMFQTSIMNYTSGSTIARHGFQSVTLKLANDYPRFKRICARHGIEISATRVRKVVKHFEAERETTRAWRKILEQTTSTLLRQSAQEHKQPPSPTTAMRRGRAAEPGCLPPAVCGATRLAACDLGRLAAGDLAHAREEEGLVDPTVEDRDAQLDALDDHVAALQARFACELGGRQVIGHRFWSPLVGSLHGQQVCLFVRTATTIS